jgi:hypothetical protein
LAQGGILKVSDLDGALLDYWVLRAEGWENDRPQDLQLTRNGEYCIAGVAPKHAVNGHCWKSPSTDWAIGGPLIEREGISLLEVAKGLWSANWMDWPSQGERDDPHTGPTPLIAAMRAFVADWFGEEVEDAPQSAG